MLGSDVIMKTVRRKLYSIAGFLEILVGVIAIIPIVIAVVTLVFQMMSIDFLSRDTLNMFIYRTFEIIIAIEFVKLIFAHTIDATVEVIIMAIVRHIIVEHTPFLDTFVLVLAIAVLFAIRKYLFIRELDQLNQQAKDFEKNEIELSQEIEGLEEEHMLES